MECTTPQGATGWCLLPGRTETRWWQTYIPPAETGRFLPRFRMPESLCCLYTH